MEDPASSAEFSVTPALPDGLSKQGLKRLARLLARLPKETPPDEVAELMFDLSERFSDWKEDLVEDEEVLDVAYNSDSSFQEGLGKGASLPPSPASAFPFPILPRIMQVPPSPTGVFSFPSLPRIMEVHTSRLVVPTLRLLMPVSFVGWRFYSCYLDVYSKGRKAPSPRSRKTDVVNLKVSSIAADQAELATAL